jgi:hypothetical protein
MAGASLDKDDWTAPDHSWEGRRCRLQQQSARRLDRHFYNIVWVFGMRRLCAMAKGVRML